MTQEHYNMLGSARIKDSKLDLDNITVTEGNISLFDERLVSNDNLFNLTMDNRPALSHSNHVTTHRTARNKGHSLEKVPNKDNKSISVRDTNVYDANQQDDKCDDNSCIVPFNHLNANFEGNNILSVLRQHNNGHSYLDSEDADNIQI